jgi:hypothetical protein
MDEVELAHTESVFREVNEAIAKSAEGFESDEAEFLCECGDPKCTHRVTAPLTDYEEVREESTRFLVATGHAEHVHERLVKRARHYDVIEKMGARLAAMVRRLDPRRRPATEPPAPE